MDARQRDRVANGVGILTLVLICLLSVLCIAEVRAMFASSITAALEKVRERTRESPRRTQPEDSGNPLQDLIVERILEIEEAKMALINSADLARIHHEVHAAIGEENWEAFAKPEFLQEIQRRTRKSTGRDPTWQDVVAWVRSHPDEANRLLESFKDDPRVQR
jgi:hypothetical protein